MPTEVGCKVLFWVLKHALGLGPGSGQFSGSNVFNSFWSFPPYFFFLFFNVNITHCYFSYSKVNGAESISDLNELGPEANAILSVI